VNFNKLFPISLGRIFQVKGQSKKIILLFSYSVLFIFSNKPCRHKEKMWRGVERKSALVYPGWEAYGKPEKIIVRGKVVFDNGKITISPGYGEIIKAYFR